MGSLGKITRRTFMFGSVAVAGGIAFGCLALSHSYANPLKPGARGAAVLNSYLIIDDKSITIVTPRAEMGQGVQTTLAAMVAEELDVRWEDVKIIHGPPSKAYFNRAAMASLAPFASYDESKLANVARDVMGGAGKFIGLQITGGSSSVADAFDKMRLAGASARHVLVEAAARQWQVAASTLKTNNGVVINPANNEQLSYMQLAKVAVDITPPEAPALKDRSQWRYLGKSMPRLDMVGKCTGTARFGIDVVMPEMLYASVKMNPKLGAKMISMDDSAAKSMRGVKQVLNLGDGVAVIADNTWRAFQALDAVKCEWAQADYPLTTEAHFAAIGKAIDDNKKDATARNNGDIEAALKQAKTVIEAEYRVPYLAHSTMEPMSAVALITDDGLDIWLGHQTPTLVKDKAIAESGLPAEKVRVHIEYLGGGFGRRSEPDFPVQALRIAKAMKGKPIKLTWTREEDIKHDVYRPAAIARCKGVVDENGYPQAVQMLISSPSVLRSFSPRAGLPALGPDKMITDGASDQPYDIANYQVVGYDPGLTLPVGNWRSVGASYNGFFHESILDELAVAGKIDPLKMRLKLAEKYPRAVKVLQEVAVLANWEQPLPVGRGRGLALTLSFGSYVAQVVEVVDTGNGIHIDKVYAVGDFGQAMDPGNLEAQMMSGIIYGLSSAMMGEIGIADGAVIQSNFHDYDAMRMAQVPQMMIKILDSDLPPTGAGEPGTPPSIPALVNAIYSLTGRRIRELPLNKSIQFV